jgi:hypothetical protein
MTVHKLLGKTNESQINQTKKIFLKPVELQIILFKNDRRFWKEEKW